MPLEPIFRRRSLSWFLVLGAFTCPTTAGAQVSREVVVGFTPNCPYPNAPKTCFYGAYEALCRLSGVESVDKTPDAYNCTATVRLRGNDLPDVARWAKEFRSQVDKAHEFRGVEVTVAGPVREVGGRLVLTAPGLKQPLNLVRLRNKLQWNFKRRAARDPEDPSERTAYEDLARKCSEDEGAPLQVEVTGPLLQSGDRYAIEVREFMISPPQDGDERCAADDKQMRNYLAPVVPTGASNGTHLRRTAPKVHRM